MTPFAPRLRFFGLEHMLTRPSLVFVVGLVLRLGLIMAIEPATQSHWFGPFLSALLKAPSFDPWTDFLASQGNVLAYPYGPVMLVWHAIGGMVGEAIGVFAHAIGIQDVGAIGFRLSLFAADFLTLIFLNRLFPRRRRLLEWYYWLSPVVLFVTYINGQTDIIPVMFLVLALLALQRMNGIGAGLALTFAIAAKFSMAVVVPFTAIYLWRNKKLRQLLPAFGMWFSAGIIMILGPCFLSSGFRVMVLGNREVDRLYNLSINFSNQISIYVVPLLYMLALYYFWRLRRISHALLMSVMGGAFYMIVLATPVPIGWYLWLVPFLLAYQFASDRTATLLVGLFSILVVSYHVINSSLAAPVWSAEPASLTNPWAHLFLPQFRSLWLTGIEAVGLVLALRSMRHGVYRNEFHQIGQKALVIGIAGDSAVGKDTLSQSLAGLFGDHSVIQISGDDYHLWERQSPMWSVVTHLDPRANDIQRLEHETLQLLRGHPISCRPYDHGTGRFMSPVSQRHNDVIILSGLHTLYPPAVREMLDVSIYLDVDEEVRTYWKLRRDVRERGHSPERVINSIEKRRPDANRFIKPQRDLADIVFLIRPNVPFVATLDIDKPLPPLGLQIHLRNNISHTKLVRFLIALGEVSVDVEPPENLSETTVMIEGEIDGRDIALIGERLLGPFLDFLDTVPKWQSGMAGVMQLFILTYLQHKLLPRIN
ncbi:phosphoribulokinase [Azospirillaceae bacterium]